MKGFKMPLVKVKPAEGARIRQPNRNSRVMPADGDVVNSSDSYYHRLITSGDLVVVKDDAEKPKAEMKAEAPPAPLKK